eukprot:5541824-Prymnesium_polylepis.1
MRPRRRARQLSAEAPDHHRPACAAARRVAVTSRFPPRMDGAVMSGAPASPRPPPPRLASPPQPVPSPLAPPPPASRPASASQSCQTLCGGEGGAAVGVRLCRTPPRAGGRKQC